jgi:hypothetical protein
MAGKGNGINPSPMRSQPVYELLFCVLPIYIIPPFLVLAAAEKASI